MLNLKLPSKVKDALSIPSFGMLFILNLCFGIILICLAEPYYETDDDFGFLQLTSGFYGEPSAHIVFANIGLGVLLKFLSSICPVVSWHWVLMFLATVLSYTAISSVLSNKIGTGWGLLFFSIFLIVSSYSFYVILNFTRVAALATASGWCASLYALESVQKKYLSIGSVLIIYGCALRFDSWLMASAVAFVYFLLYLLRELYPFRKNCVLTFLREKTTYILYLVGLVFIVGVLVVCDKASYQISPEYSQYIDFNHNRSQLVDYSVPDYESNKIVYDQLGITSEDTDMIRNWTFADPEVFSPEAIEAIASLRTHTPLNYSSISSCILSACTTLVQSPLFLLGLFFSIISALLALRPHLLEQIILLAVTLSLMGYLCFAGRVLTRVTVGLTVTYALFIICCWKKQDFHPFPQDLFRRIAAAFAAFLSCILLNGNLLFDHTSYGKHTAPAEERQSQIEQIESTLNLSNLYLVDTFSRIHYYTLFSYWEGLQGFEQSNVLPLGSSLTMHPIAYGQVLERYNVQNPFRALIEKDNVFLIDSQNYTDKKDYLERHYVQEVNLSVVDQVLGRYIFAATSLPAEIEVQENPDIRVEIEESACDKEAEDGEQMHWFHGQIYTQEQLNNEQCYYVELSQNENSGYYRFILTEGTNEFEFGIPEEDIAAGTYACRIIAKHKDSDNFLWQVNTAPITIS